MRRAYDDASHAMAERFVERAREGEVGCAGRTSPDPGLRGVRERRTPKPVAYFLVDAMRYEMGVELVERLPGGLGGRRIRPAVGACRASRRSEWRR